MGKAKLTLLSLIALGAMSLASCTGAQGEKGDKGDQGEQGIQGEPGEPGEPGEDGSLWYSGEGTPSNDLGKEGDMYLDTATSDVYQKGADGWTKIANIKGDDGEDGEDGEDGKNGSNGSDGKTAWSNTILPSEGGYVTVDVGSATINEDVTFYVHPDTGYKLEDITIRNNGIEVDLPKGVVVEGIASYTLSMLENGFVVHAVFSKNAGGSIYYENGIPHTGGEVDGMGNVIKEGTPNLSGTTFESGDGYSSDSPLVFSNENAENFTTTFLSMSNNDVIESGAKYFALPETSTPEIFVVKDTDLGFTDGSGQSKRPGETIINLNGNTLTINKNETSGKSGPTQIVEGQKVVFKNGSIDYNVDFDKTTGSSNETEDSKKTASRAAFSIKTGGSFTLDGVDYSANRTALFAAGDSAEINIIDSTVKGVMYGVGTNAGKTDNYNVKINIDGSKIVVEDAKDEAEYESTGLFLVVPSEVTIRDSLVSSQKIGMLARGGDIELENVDFYNDSSFYDNSPDGDKYYDGSRWDSGTGVPASVITVGNHLNNAYKYDVNVSLKNVDFYDGLYSLDSSNNLTNANSGESTTTSKLRENPYKLYVNGYDNPDETVSTVTTVKIDNHTYSNVKDDLYLLKNDVTHLYIEGEEVGDLAFDNGQLYKNVVRNSDGSVNTELSTIVEEVSFDGGEGTEASPFVIKSLKAFKSIEELSSYFEYSDLTSFYFVQEADIVLETGDDTISDFAGNYDGKDFQISLKEDISLTSYKGVFGFLSGGIYDKDTNSVTSKASVTLKNIKIGVRNKQPLTLISDPTWDSDRFVTGVLVDGFEVVSLDNKPVEVNLNNFGFITPNPLGYFSETRDNSTSSFEFKNITIKASAQNLGTCISPLIGSGIMGDNYEKVVFENIHVEGEYISSSYAGLLWGNGTYTGINTTSYPDVIPNDKLIVKNITGNATVTGLKGTAKSDSSSTTTVWYVTGATNLLTDDELATITGNFTFNDKTANELNSTSVSYKYNKATQEIVYTSNPDRTYKSYLSVGQVKWTDGVTVSNGVKADIGTTRVEDLNDSNYVSLDSIVLCDTNNYVTQTNNALSSDDIETISEFPLLFNGVYDAAILVKDNAVYLVFDGSKVGTVENGVTIGFYLFDSNGRLVGVK